MLEHLERELEYMVGKFRQREQDHLELVDSLREIGSAKGQEQVHQDRVELHEELAKVYGDLARFFDNLAREVALDRYELERWAKGD